MPASKSGHRGSIPRLGASSTLKGNMEDTTLIIDDPLNADTPAPASQPDTPAPPPKLDYRRLNDPATEQDQLEQYAQATVGAMEIAAIFVQAVESWGYSKIVLDRFEKYVRKALNELESEIPNQYKRRVLQLAQAAMAEADYAQEDDGTRPDPNQPDIITALMGLKQKEQMEADLAKQIESEAAVEVTADGAATNAPTA
jgi:hypothetical protein